MQRQKARWRSAERPPGPGAHAVRLPGRGSLRGAARGPGERTRKSAARPPGAAPRLWQGSPERLRCSLWSPRLRFGLGGRGREMVQPEAMPRSFVLVRETPRTEHNASSTPLPCATGQKGRLASGYTPPPPPPPHSTTRQPAPLLRKERYPRLKMTDEREHWFHLF